jgi:hypothetical protein
MDPKMASPSPEDVSSSGGAKLRSVRAESTGNIREYRCDERTASAGVLSGSVKTTLRRLSAAGVFLIGFALPASTEDSFVHLRSEAREKLESGIAVVEVLPARQADLAVFGAVRIDVTDNRLFSWVRQIDRFQLGRYVPVSRRFSILHGWRIWTRWCWTMRIERPPSLSSATA